MRVSRKVEDKCWFSRSREERAMERERKGEREKGECGERWPISLARVQPKPLGELRPTET